MTWTENRLSQNFAASIQMETLFVRKSELQPHHLVLHFGTPFPSPCQNTQMKIMHIKKKHTMMTSNVSLF